VSGSHIRTSAIGLQTTALLRLCARDLDHLTASLPGRGEFRPGVRLRQGRIGRLHVSVDRCFLHLTVLEKMRPLRPQYSFGARSSAAPCRISLSPTPEDQHAYAATQVVLRRFDSSIDDTAIRVDALVIRIGARASGHQHHTGSGAERSNARDIFRW